MKCVVLYGCAGMGMVCGYMMVWCVVVCWVCGGIGCVVMYGYVYGVCWVCDGVDVVVYRYVVVLGVWWYWVCGGVVCSGVWVMMCVLVLWYVYWSCCWFSRWRAMRRF